MMTMTTTMMIVPMMMTMTMTMRMTMMMTMIAKAKTPDAANTPQGPKHLDPILPENTHQNPMDRLLDPIPLENILQNHIHPENTQPGLNQYQQDPTQTDQLLKPQDQKPPDLTPTDPPDHRLLNQRQQNLNHHSNLATMSTTSTATTRTPGLASLV